jgi:hypothetical protein
VTGHQQCLPGGDELRIGERRALVVSAASELIATSISDCLACSGPTRDVGTE